jgi:hypothetical protein
MRTLPTGVIATSTANIRTYRQGCIHCGQVIEGNTVTELQTKLANHGEDTK